ncbi:peptidylprolyl isomerase [Caulobacter vibrioides]|uniref:peptidylprolyl isomerase n=1 Tax=Caulobacter vibrioides TaxID=155892 RepID=UPI000BB4775A|nr:peptidylprolyl isomerase [Caulobacter vibrioides]ATC24595.1 peptidylprolyl isomerase [Caulobacter vibrioides]AZH12733.1 peptidylprolyl isomerase [Caulobacter vibrioides]PLR10160.1 peptidylprolyl isomerase [Caulobacter vibrioides]
MKLAMTAAALALAATTVSFGAASAQAVSDWRTPDPNNVLVVETNKGRIIAELYPEVAPNHVERVRGLAKSGFYDGLTFFRVISDFMAQTGDPKNTGEGGSDLPDLTAEFNFRRGADMPLGAGFKVGSNESGWVYALPVTSQPSALAVMTADRKVSTWGNFCPGVVGMARAGDPNSANSQFYFMRAANAGLDKTYTAFGRVLQGVDVVKAIKTGEPVPDPQDKMLSVKVLADIPADKRPTIQVMDTRGPAFKALVTKRQGELGSSFTNCDVDVPAQVK